MIPEDCALTVRNGVVCGVGPDGAVSISPLERTSDSRMDPDTDRDIHLEVNIDG